MADVLSAGKYQVREQQRMFFLLKLLPVFSHREPCYRVHELGGKLLQRPQNKAVLEDIPAR